MGIDLCLGNDDDYLFDANVINEYYDYLEGKELDYLPDDIHEELRATAERRVDPDIVEETCGNRTVICERWLSAIHGVEMDDLFTRQNSVIYGDDIRVFIERLREEKRKLKQDGDPDWWESYFELRLIALCEFAVEHECGVRLSV